MNGATAVTIQGQRVETIKSADGNPHSWGVPCQPAVPHSAVGNVTSLTNAIANDAYLQVYRADAREP